MQENGERSKNELVAEIKTIMAPKKKKSKTPTAVIFLVILALIILSPMAAKFIADKYTDKKLTELLNSLKGPCYVIYEKSEYDIWTRHLKVTNSSVICGEEEAARFGAVDFAHIVSGTPLPANLSAEFSDGVINADAKIFGRYGKLAAQMGYGPVPVSGNIIFTLGPVSKTFKLEKFSLNAGYVGTLSAEFRVDDVNAKTAQGAFEQIISNDCSAMWASFYDEGLAKRIIARYAKTINSDNATAKARALHGIERRISNKYKDDPVTRDQLIQVYRFIENPAYIVMKSDNETKASVLSVVESADYEGWRRLLSSLEHFPLKLYAN